MAIIKKFLLCFLLISSFTQEITSMNVMQRYLKQGKKPSVFKKPYKTFKPMKQKGAGTFSIKSQRFYTTKNPQESSYFEQFKKKLGNWYNELFYGGGKDLKKKEKLYKQHQQLLNKIHFKDQETRKKAEMLHQDLFEKMTETINRGGIPLVTQVSALELMSFKLFGQTKDLKTETNEAKLYQFVGSDWKSYVDDPYAFINSLKTSSAKGVIQGYGINSAGELGHLTWKKSLFTINNGEKIDGLIEDVFNNHTIEIKGQVTDPALLKELGFEQKTYDISDENVLFAQILDYVKHQKKMTLFQEGIKEQGSTKQDLLEDAELELKILDIIKSYCNGYKEPVLLNIVHPKKIIEVISASKVYSKLDKIRKRNLILSG